jgi:transposase
MAFIRKIKKGDAVYLAKVESYREDGKVKQRVIEYVGKEVDGRPVQKVDINSLEVENVKRYADVAVLHQVSLDLKLNYLLGKHHKSIIALLIAHLLCKGSVLRLSKWIEQSTIKETLGIPELSTEMLYRSLDHLEDCDFDDIEIALQDHWTKLAPEDNNSFVLDVTDTYYNGKNDESLPRKGKDGKISKLIQIGLAVSFDNGFPIMHQQFRGNLSNIKILENMMYKMANRGMRSIVLDRGFFSEANVADMNNLGMKMIVGVKQSRGIKSDILSKIDRNIIYAAKNQVVLKNTIVYAMETEFLFGKLIIIYNPKYEALKRDKMLAEKATDEEVKYIGYSLIFHNTGLKIQTVVKKYFEKDIVERSFRSMKGEIQLHPIRLWLPKRINAHIKLCYLSMCMLSLIKFRCRKLDLSAKEILDELETIYQVNLKHKATKKSFSKTVTQSNLQKNILKKLKCSV